MAVLQSFIHSILTGLTCTFALILCLVFAACSDKNVDPDKFINAYADLRIAEDTLAVTNDKMQEVKNGILKKYGLTEDEYRTSFEYYNENPELWEQFYDKVIARVDTLKKRQRK